MYYVVIGKNADTVYRKGHFWGFPGGSVVKNPPANGTLLQYFCLENPMDGGAW